MVVDAMPVLAKGCWGGADAKNSKKALLYYLVPLCKENTIFVLPEKKLRGFSPNFHIQVSERFIYSHDRSTYFPVAE